MAFEFTLSDTLPASPRAVYDAWLSSEGHTAMTGAQAHASAEEGAAFDAWEGYISGRNLTLEPGRRIVQAWRTTNFTDNDPDSQIELTLAPADGGCAITLRHSDVPDGHDGYRSGWVSHYFEPMKAYFANAG